VERDPSRQVDDLTRPLGRIVRHSPAPRTAPRRRIDHENRWIVAQTTRARRVESEIIMIRIWGDNAPARPLRHHPARRTRRQNQETLNLGDAMRPQDRYTREGADAHSRSHLASPAFANDLCERPGDMDASGLLPAALAGGPLGRLLRAGVFTLAAR